MKPFVQDDCILYIHSEAYHRAVHTVHKAVQQQLLCLEMFLHTLPSPVRGAGDDNKTTLPF